MNIKMLCKKITFFSKVSIYMAANSIGESRFVLSKLYYILYN